jgi:hypothetical protein
VLFISAKLDGNSGHYSTWGARRKGDARLPVQYTNSTDDGNKSIQQNCGVIPKGKYAPQFFIFLKGVWTGFLIVDPRPEPLSEQHLIRLVATRAEKEFFWSGHKNRKKPSIHHHSSVMTLPNKNNLKQSCL